MAIDPTLCAHVLKRCEVYCVPHKMPLCGSCSYIIIIFVRF